MPPWSSSVRGAHEIPGVHAVRQGRALRRCWPHHPRPRGAIRAAPQACNSLPAAGWGPTRESGGVHRPSDEPHLDPPLFKRRVKEWRGGFALELPLACHPDVLFVIYSCPPHGPVAFTKRAGHEEIPLRPGCGTVMRFLLGSGHTIGDAAGCSRRTPRRDRHGLHPTGSLLP
jgi:hypothetical protein